MTYFDDLQWEGRRCIVNDLNSKTGREVIRRIGSLVGQGIEDAAKAGLDANVEVAGALAFGGIIKRLDQNTVEWLTSTFLTVTLVESEPGNEQWVPAKSVEELLFGGSAGQGRWFRWISFCLENACGDFFAAAFARFSRARASVSMMGSKTRLDPAHPNGASPSPSTSSSPGGFTA